MIDGSMWGKRVRVGHRLDGGGGHVRLCGSAAGLQQGWLLLSPGHGCRRLHCQKRIACSAPRPMQTTQHRSRLALCRHPLLNPRTPLTLRLPHPHPPNHRPAFRIFLITYGAALYFGFVSRQLDLGWLYDNFAQLLTAAIIFSSALSVYLYASSFRKGALLSGHGATG